MTQNNQNHDQEFQEEYKHFNSDVKRVIVVNLLILGLLIGLFIVDKSTGFVDKTLQQF